MKRFLGFVRKEFFHIFRDPRTLLILFGMPIAQILLFGYAVTNEIKEAKIAIYDPAKDEITEAITQRLIATPYYQLGAYLDDMEEAEAALRANKVKQVVMFEPGFGEKFQRNGKATVRIISDATDPNTANTLQNYSQAIILGYQMEEKQKRAANQDLPIIQVETRMRYNLELKGVFLFVPGLITIILMLVSAMMTSISIAREKELGTMELLLASPMKPIQIILGKVTPYIFLSIINAAVILILGYYVFGVPISGSLLLLSLECLLFIISALCLGILISTVAKTQQVALMMSLMALMLPTILLSGFMFPIENMPKVLQVISNIIPARWFIVIVKNIMLKGSEFAVIWKETLILFGFTVFFLLVSSRKFQVRLT